MQIPIEDLDNVPVKYLQQAFEESSVDAQQGANNMGWFHSNETADSSRFLRTIGLRPINQSRADRPDSYRTHVKYELAVRLAEAMQYDPVDLGL